MTVRANEIKRPLVQIKNLSKHYTRGDQDVAVLTDITLDIPRVISSH